MRFILLPLAAAMFIIGIHQSITTSIPEAYGWFMLTVVLLLLARLVGIKDTPARKTEGDKPTPPPARPKGKGPQSTPTRRSR